MNPTEIILLTALVNIIITGLISGVAVYRIQRKIDSSFASKLEKFRAGLQYSNFEQQTKFAATYPKRVEALQALYEKYRTFQRAFGDWSRAMGDEMQHKKELDQKLHEGRRNYVEGTLNDF